MCACTIGGRERGVGGPGGRGRGGVLDRRDVLDIMHGRSRMTIDPRIPTMPGQSTSGFRQPGGHSQHQVRSPVRYSASRVKGELHPLLRTTCVADSPVDDSFDEAGGGGDFARLVGLIRD